MPGADLRSVSLREEGDSLVMTMQVADLTPAARSSAAASVANGDGMLYLTQWDYADTVYWLGAEVRATGTSFYTGTLGMIRSATSKKFITYNPDLVKSQQVQGQMTASRAGSNHDSHSEEPGRQSAGGRRVPFGYRLRAFRAWATYSCRNNASKRPVPGAED